MIYITRTKSATLLKTYPVLCLLHFGWHKMQLARSTYKMYNWYKAIKQYTVISWLHGEQSNYCPEVVEKVWETVARDRRERPTVSLIFSITEGQWFDRSPSSLEITVLLPNCFKSPKHGQQYADARRWRRDMWRFVTSFITWPVNSSLLTGQ